MPGFNLGGAVNGAADWVCNAPVVRGVVGSPVLTALLITTLVVVVVMALCHYPARRVGRKTAARVIIYIFLLVAAVTFVHHYAVVQSARDAASMQGVRDIFTSIQQSRESGAAPLLPPAAAVGGAEAGPAPAGAGPAGGAGAGPAGGAAGGCGCALAGGRPDNVALGDVVIEDVVVPAAVGPFGAR